MRRNRIAPLSARSVHHMPLPGTNKIDHAQLRLWAADSSLKQQAIPTGAINV